MGLPETKFEEFGDGIKTTIYRATGDGSFDPKNALVDPKNDPRNALDDPKNGLNDPRNALDDPKNFNDPDGALSDYERGIIDLIKRDGKITQKTIAETLGISLKTVKRNMTSLQSKGLIKRVGFNKGGYWEARE
jgi:predicted HTH transcriptional regulator